MTTVQQPRVATHADAVLLRRAAAGDETAFRAVYDRHVAAIRGYARGRVGPDAADDIVSEAFATAWRSSSQFDPDAASARPWLYGIATNVVARHREREQRWMQQRADQSLSDSASSDEPTVFELDPGLTRALARLSPPLRDVLLLTSLGELSIAEAGRALGISPTAARVRLLRARRAVRQSLEGGST